MSIFFNSLSFDNSILTQKFLLGDVLKSGKSGGIFSILVSTLVVVLIAVVPTTFLSLFSGFFLFRLKNKYINIYRVFDFFIYILLAMPSIVFGLFGNVIFVHYFKFGHSLLAGGVTLFCMLLPFTIKISQLSFENIDPDILIATEALGIKTWNVFYKVLFPLVVVDILVGFLIALGRALAETAVLLFTSGFVTRFPESVFDSGRVLSVHIYELVMNVPGGNIMAQKSVTILILSVLVINFVINILIKKFRRLRYE